MQMPLLVEMTMRCPPADPCLAEPGIETNATEAIP